MGYEDLSSRFGVETSKSFPTTLRLLGLTERQIVGSNILEIGPGGGEFGMNIIGRDLADYLAINPHAVVPRPHSITQELVFQAGLDPYLNSLTREERTRLAQELSERTLPVDAIIGLRQLVKDGRTFDWVLAVTSVPYWMNDRAEVQELLALSAQTLKQGGEFRAWPYRDRVSAPGGSSKIELAMDSEVNAYLHQLRSKYGVEVEGPPFREYETRILFVMKKGL